MLDKFLQNAIEDAGATGRLREMIGVLRRREVVRGMTPEKLRQVLEDLGPTFVKLGQIMSMRPDFLPPEYCDELMKLQSGAKPLPFPIILEVIEKEYSRRWSQIFRSIDEEALGSASIAQVHRAVLTSGEKVVIKVQRPGIYEIMSKDIVLLKRAATLLKIVSHSQDVLDFNMVLDEMWTIAKQEMDFLMEADHIEEFEHLNRDVDYVSCPRVFRQLSTQHILVMEFVDGIRIDDFDKLRANGYDINLLGRHLGENYVKQIIEDGYFHADPHPGNIWVKNGRIVWLDLGMMGRLSSRDRIAIRKAVMALANHDTFEMKAAVLSLGVVRGRINHTALYQDIDSMMAQYSSLDFKSLQMGVLTRQIMNILRVHRIVCPQGLSMFARGVLTIEGVMRLCCPKVSFVEIFAKSLALDFKRPDEGQPRPHGLGGAAEPHGQDDQQGHSCCALRSAAPRIQHDLHDEYDAEDHGDSAARFPRVPHRLRAEHPPDLGNTQRSLAPRPAALRRAFCLWFCGGGIRRIMVKCDRKQFLIAAHAQDMGA